MVLRVFVCRLELLQSTLINCPRSKVDNGLLLFVKTTSNLSIHACYEDGGGQKYELNFWLSTYSVVIVGCSGLAVNNGVCKDIASLLVSGPLSIVAQIRAEKVTGKGFSNRSIVYFNNILLNFSYFPFTNRKGNNSFHRHFKVPPWILK